MFKSAISSSKRKHFLSIQIKAYESSKWEVIKALKMWKNNKWMTITFVKFSIRFNDGINPWPLERRSWSQSLFLKLLLRFNGFTQEHDGEGHVEAVEQLLRRRLAQQQLVLHALGDLGSFNFTIVTAILPKILACFTYKNKCFHLWNGRAFWINCHIYYLVVKLIPGEAL